MHLQLATEKVRLYRGMYRFQLCCNLFGRGGHKSNPPNRLHMNADDIRGQFVASFEPWEVEEMCCVYDFVSQRYSSIFESNPDLSTNFDPRGVPLDEWDRERLLIGTVSHGLQVLRTISEIKDSAKLASTTKAYMQKPLGPFLVGFDEALGAVGPLRLEKAQGNRQRMAEREAKQSCRDPLPFSGEGDLLPPLAWTIIWGGTYSKLVGWYIPDALHRWGYVFWDAARLDHMGAQAVLRCQWTKRFGHTDPRGKYDPLPAMVNDDDDDDDDDGSEEFSSDFDSEGE